MGQCNSSALKNEAHNRNLNIWATALAHITVNRLVVTESEGHIGQ